MTWIRHPMAPLMSMVAGSILLGRVLVEAVMIQEGRGLHVVIAIYALVLIRLGWVLLRRQLTQEARKISVTTRSPEHGGFQLLIDTILYHL